MFKTCLFHMEFVLLEVGLSVKVLYLRTIFPLLRTEASSTQSLNTKKELQHNGKWKLPVGLK